MAVITLFSAVSCAVFVPSTNVSAATSCTSKSFSTKTNSKNTCNTYIHAILIGDGITLSKYSTSQYFTASTKSAVQRFQAKYLSITATTNGSVGASTWKALCTVAAKRKLEQFNLAGCTKYVTTTQAKSLFQQSYPNAYQTGETTIASWNTLYDNTPSAVGSGAASLAARAQIISFQELNSPDRRQAIKASLIECAGCHYSGYFPDSTGDGWGTSATVSLAWDTQRFTALKTGTYAVLGDKAYGANTSNKWINWVKLRDDTTGKQLYVLNTHFTAGVEKNGVATTTTAAQKNYQAHMNYLVNVLTTLAKEKVAVYVTGDFNVDYRLDSTVSYFPNKALSAIKMTNGWKQLGLAGVEESSGSLVASPTATVKNRILDYVWTNARPEETPVAMAINSDSYGSDHYPVLYTLRTSVAANGSL